MNLVGHVAVAARDDRAAPGTDFLVGCMLPDLAAITRVRLARPGGELGRGVEFHHACDAAFHESEWFRAQNVELRDALFDAGVEHGAARACSHAGLEMLLDGAVVVDAPVAASVRRALGAVDAGAAELAELAPAESRVVVRERLELIGRSLDPARYAEPRFVAERLHRMTAGRRRIELRIEHVEIVTRALTDFQPAVARDARDVIDAVHRLVDQQAVDGDQRPPRG